jgi:hypothetical protein
MTPPGFADHFRLHAIPRVRAAINAAAKSRDFATITGAAWDEARRLGAGYLDQPHFDAFREWLTITAAAELDLVDEADNLVTTLMREPSRDVMRGAVRAFLRV